FHQAVGFEAAEGDATIRTMIDHRALAGIAQTVTVCTAIGDVELAPTVATSQKTRQQRSSVARWTAHELPLHSRVLRDLALVGVVFIPVDVALVMDRDQNLPLLLRHANT